MLKALTKTRLLNFTTVRRVSKKMVLQASSDLFKVEQAPRDPVIGMQEKFNESKSAQKVNLGVGEYKDEMGLPYRLDSVKKAKEIVQKNPYPVSYLPITGSKKFNELSQNLVFGENNKRILTVQTLSGTGALSLTAAYLKKFEKADTVYFSDPTWPNHFNIFKSAGHKTATYPYLDRENFTVKTDEMLEFFEKLPDGSTICIQPAAHNPTGVDLSTDDWDKLIKVFKEKNHFAILDTAYQGFCSGDVKVDRFGVLKFMESGLPFFVCQSYAKNMGLYCERVGSLSMVAESDKEIPNLESQIKIIIRSLYSSPPAFGAKCIEQILGSQELTNAWYNDLKIMSTRISKMRMDLHSKIVSSNPKLKMDHIVNQRGMFCYTGLTPQQTALIEQRHSIFMSKDGRISISGLNESNVDYVAKAIVDVLNTK